MQITVHRETGWVWMYGGGEINEMAELLEVSDRVFGMVSEWAHTPMSHDRTLSGVLADMIEDDCEDCPARERVLKFLRNRFMTTGV